jgi:hypothetical protein
MCCPRCGAHQTEDLKFCKTCGVNLHAVRQVVETKEGGKKFDWTSLYQTVGLVNCEDWGRALTARAL